MLEVFAAMTLWGSYLFFCLAILAVFVIIVASEVGEAGYWSAVSLGAFILLMAKWGTGYHSINPWSIFSWLNVSLYLLAGLIYSFIRIYFLARNVKDDEKGHYIDTYEKKVDYLKEKAIGNFGRWILQWPISLFVFTLTDVFKYIGRWLSDIFGDVISNLIKKGLAHAGFNPEEKEKKN